METSSTTKSVIRSRLRHGLIAPVMMLVATLGTSADAGMPGVRRAIGGSGPGIIWQAAGECAHAVSLISSDQSSPMLDVFGR